MPHPRALVATLAAVAALGSCGPEPLPTPPLVSEGESRPPLGAFHATVLWITDGDTLGARDSGRYAVRVRIIGVDTPETKRPGVGVQCFGREAAAELARLIPPGSIVTAARQHDEVDRYGRDLWDVWLPDGRLLSSILVGGGFGRAAPFAGNDRDAAALEALEASARARGLGLWGSCSTARQHTRNERSSNRSP